MTYTITKNDDIVTLDMPLTNGERKSIQLTFNEFCIFMTYPNLNVDEIFEKLWVITDKRQGKVKVRQIVEDVLSILRGDENE